MVSKNRIKLIRSLEQKKFRKEEGLFVAEGHKTVEDLLPVFDCTFLAADKEWISRQKACLEMLKREGTEIEVVTAEELKRLSLLKTPQNVLALFRQPSYSVVPENILATQLCLGLDGIQDPGNLGTIVRIADWFGIKHVFCSPDTADVYNPKCIQATMGALARVEVHYLPLDILLENCTEHIPVYGTFLDGKNIYAQPLSENGLIIMGNEGNGVSGEIAARIGKRLYIPNFPAGSPTSESLNVAVATAIVCAEFRRRMAWLSTSSPTGTRAGF